MTEFMWHVSLTNKPQLRTPHTHQAANSLMDRWTKPYLSQWYQTTLFGPAKQTILQAINNGYLIIYPNLTITNWISISTYKRVVTVRAPFMNLLTMDKIYRVKNIIIKNIWENL